MTTLFGQDQCARGRPVISAQRQSCEQLQLQQTLNLGAYTVVQFSRACCGCSLAESELRPKRPFESQKIQVHTHFSASTPLDGKSLDGTQSCTLAQPAYLSWLIGDLAPGIGPLLALLLVVGGSRPSAPAPAPARPGAAGLPCLLPSLLCFASVTCAYAWLVLGVLTHRGSNMMHR